MLEKILNYKKQIPLSTPCQRPLKRMLLQWHITERCNLRCSHCYQENYSSNELSYSSLIHILEQYKEFLLRYKSETPNALLKAHVTVTGGEPFIRSDFFDLLEVFHKNRNLFSFAILTNGTFIDPYAAKHLKKLNPSFIQVSIEGTKATHDQIRGKGSYEKTLSALRHLVKENITTYISFTAHKKNYMEFPDVCRLGRKLKVDKVWSDRLIPWGSGSDLKELLLTPEETRKFFEIMYRCKNNMFYKLFGKTEIAMHRALQFLIAGGRPYQCSAGKTLITVQPNGDLLPCRRMPAVVGNLLETSLHVLYNGSGLFQQLRAPTSLNTGCEQCFYSKLCRGGLKCLSYAVTGSPFHKDPGCWMK
ncbi:MAG: radical SAM protein [Clostridia bacterium]|nr:radical SAM protein [Clostridia bacterium]